MATQAQIEEAQQEARDAKNAPKIDKAYTKSLRNTEEAPAKDPRDVIRGQRGYAKGGSVSSRADGIAQRGKTRGKMC
jgi:ribosomal protein L18